MNGTTTPTSNVLQTELISYRINLPRVAMPALVFGGGALALALVVGLIAKATAGAGDAGFAHFMHAYLAGFIFWFGITCGCIALTMLHHLTGGRWGEVLRPLLETGIKAVPLMFVLGLPILFGMKWLYPWTQDEQFMGKALRHQHEKWTYPSFFIVRYFIYFAVLMGFRFLLLRKYRLRDEMAVQDPAHNSDARFRLISGPGILIYGVLVTLALADWGMSAQAGWYSTLYGMLSIVGQGLSTMAFMVVATTLITRGYEVHRGHADDVHHHGTLVGKQDWHDLGNLLFAMTMLWGYLSLSQMLITYSGNLPQETIFYYFRSTNGWQYVGGFLIVLHFCLPFFLLLMRDIKRDPRRLVLVALFILVVRQLDLYYQVHPSYAQGFRDGNGELFNQVGGALGWHTILNVLIPFGMGGLWVAFFAWNLRDRRVLPAPASEDHHHG